MKWYSVNIWMMYLSAVRACSQCALMTWSYSVCIRLTFQKKNEEIEKLKFAFQLLLINRSVIIFIRTDAEIQMCCSENTLQWYSKIKFSILCSSLNCIVCLRCDCLKCQFNITKLSSSLIKQRSLSCAGLFYSFVGWLALFCVILSSGSSLFKYFI